MAQENATERLTRLLTMVPWLMHRPGIDIAEAAEGLGVSPRQLEDDLRLLFLCGYGQMPDELIDAEWEGGHVFVRNAETISRPLRLGVDEAITLIVGLRTLLESASDDARSTIERTLAKIEAAAGSAGDAANRVSVALDGAAAELLDQAQRAVREHRRVHLRYLVPGRDEHTERDVDPMRVAALDGRVYLEGWCHRAQDTRLFRLDRIEALEVLDVDGTPPPDAIPRDLDAGAFQPGADDIQVTIRLAARAAWVSDYYPVESVTPLPGGGQRVTLRTPDAAWLVRLVLRLGGAAVVEEPPVLVDEVTRQAAAALAAYES